MVISGEWRGNPVVISVKPDCLTISVGPIDTAQVFSFDYGGRLWTAFVDGVTYRRGLDGRVLAKWRTPEDGRLRQWLDPEEGREVERKARETTVALYDALDSREVGLKSPLPPNGRVVLEKVVAFDEERSTRDIQRYHQIYKPVGILPPDQYMAVVLQATEGCSFNTCTFCDIYKERPFRIKKPSEFRQHAQAVRKFLSEGLRLRRSIFLADANALVAPMTTLLPLLSIVHEVFDVEALGGIAAFLDGFSGEKKSRKDYLTLRHAGVNRIYIGLESGNGELLRFLKKPGDPDSVVQAARSMKDGGIRVGVIVLLGAGGKQYAQAHIRDSIQVINQMGLGGDDLIYFSELVVTDKMMYAQTATDAGLSPLSHEERLEQGAEICEGLRFSEKTGPPRISRYDIREFIY